MDSISWRSEACRESAGLDRERGRRMVSASHSAPASSGDSGGAYDAKRGQYQSVEIMKMLAQHAPRDASRILGVTEVDLAIPMLSFLFGQAQFDGRSPWSRSAGCIRSSMDFRRRRPCCGSARSKEVLHELGHTFGLVHCSDPTCAMSLATHIELVDAKAERYCARCGLQLAA